MENDAIGERARSRSQLRPGEIKIDRLGKRYWLQSALDDEEDAPNDGEDDTEDRSEGASSRLMSLFGGQKSELWALRNITCQIQPGDRVAIVGANGSGKSTLIQILSRILPPSEGSVSGAGMVVPFGALRKPISPQASGAENLRMLARLLGIPLPHLEERLPDIVAFSGLGRLGNEKVSRYSERSYARLSMAMALLVDADVYLVDDDLKVGDEVFREKFEVKLAEVFREKVTVVYASNNLGQVRSLCRRALWLSQGRLAADGEVNTVIQRFLATSDDAVDFAELIAEAPAPPIPALSKLPVRHQPGNALREQDWTRANVRTESEWIHAGKRWKEKSRTQDRAIIGGGMFVEKCTLGNILSIASLDAEGHAFGAFLPGEDIDIDLQIETYAPAVRIAVRLELTCQNMLAFAAEPLIHFVADRPAQFSFRVVIPAILWARSPARMFIKARAVVTFEDKLRTLSEQTKAKTEFSIRGDVLAQFDAHRQATGQQVMSISDPAPSLRGGRNSDRQPVLHPKLDWAVSRLSGEETEANNPQTKAG